MSPLILLLLAAAVLMIAGAAIALVTGGGRAQVDARLEQFVGVTDAELEEELAEAGRRDTTDRLDRAIAGRGFSQRIKQRIARADLKMRVIEYIFLQIICAAGLGLAAYYFFSENLFFAALAAFFGLYIPRIYLGVAAKRRLAAFEDQLSDTLNLWVNALRSGYSVLQAMEAVATELPPPISSEFERVVQEVRLGLGVEEALHNMWRRMPSEDLDLIITAVNIQREVGGNLAEVLDIISHTIRERVRIKGEIRTLTAQGRMSGIVISVLPIALGLILYAINPDYMGELIVWEDPIIMNLIPCGWIAIGIGLAMITFGWIAIQKIVTIEV